MANKLVARGSYRNFKYGIYRISEDNYSALVSNPGEETWRLQTTRDFLGLFSRIFALIRAASS